jgi:tetratricopeptide (TPR) repeat protein
VDYALNEWTVDRVPMHWASAMNNLAIVMTRIGEREKDPVRLEEAVSICHSALDHCPQNRAPRLWVQLNLCLASSLLRHFECVVGTTPIGFIYEGRHHEVMSAFGPHRLDYLTIVDALSRREEGIKWLQEGCDVTKNTLSEISRDLEPMLWAKANMVLSSINFRLSDHEEGTESLEIAKLAAEESASFWKRDQFPLYWAQTQFNLGNIHLRMGERRSDVEALRNAIHSFRAALDETSKLGVSMDVGNAKTGLSASLFKLGELENNISMGRESVEMSLAAIKIFNEIGVTQLAERTSTNHSNAAATLASMEDNLNNLKEEN